MVEAVSCLSVVMPSYNEAATIETVIRQVLASPYVQELIVVDDGSSDDSVAIVNGIDDPRIRLFQQPINLGKGAALRRGFSEATSPYVIVQDADLEYDPAEYSTVLGPLLAGDADVVFGSRFHSGQAHRVLYYWHSVGNRLLTTASNMFTNLNLTDMETCYKAFRREVIQSITIEEDRFGFEPEVTAKIAELARNENIKVYEVGISYRGRTYREGKKIGLKDGFRALYCIIKYNTSQLANFVKYSLSGLLIVIIQFAVLVGCVEFGNLTSFAGLSGAHAASIEASIIAGFIIHYVITWRGRLKGAGAVIKNFLYFHLFNLFPFAARVAVFSVLIRQTHLNYLVSALISVGIALLFNFWGYNYLIFTKKNISVRKY